MRGDGRLTSIVWGIGDPGALKWVYAEPTHQKSSYFLDFSFLMIVRSPRVDASFPATFFSVSVTGASIEPDLQDLLQFLPDSLLRHQFAVLYLFEEMFAFLYPQSQFLCCKPFLHPGLPDTGCIVISNLPFHVIEQIPFPPFCGNC